MLQELSRDCADVVEPLDVELVSPVGETGLGQGGQLHRSAADLVGWALHSHRGRVEEGYGA